MTSVAKSQAVDINYTRLIFADHGVNVSEEY